MSILEELWYGNIEPAEYDISPNKKYKEMLQLISRNEDKLLATMTDAQKELFTNTQIVSENIKSWQSACHSRTAFGWVPGSCWKLWQNN